MQRTFQRKDEYFTRMQQGLIFDSDSTVVIIYKRLAGKCTKMLMVAIAK